MDVTGRADEWVRLRRSELSEEHQAAAWMEMPAEVWSDVLSRYPDMAEWVAHAKRSPAEIVANLAKHPDACVRATVAAQRRLDPSVRRELAADADEMVRASAHAS
jgi:hypothetical protein